jgi:hypothetical protein
MQVIVREWSTIVDDVTMQQEGGTGGGAGKKPDCRSLTVTRLAFEVDVKGKEKGSTIG